MMKLTVNSYEKKTFGTSGNLAKFVFWSMFHSRIEVFQNCSALFCISSLVRGKFEGTRENLKHKNQALMDALNALCCFFPGFFSYLMQMGIRPIVIEMDTQRIPQGLDTGHFLTAMLVGAVLRSTLMRLTRTSKSSEALKKDPTFGFLTFEYALKNQVLGRPF